MNQTSETFVPGHRRTRSLDLTDSLQRLEFHRQRRQQYLENRAKFNGTQTPPNIAPPPIPTPRSSLQFSSISQSTGNKKDVPRSSLVVPSKTLLPAFTKDEVDTANTLLSTDRLNITGTSTSSLVQETPRSVTPISELIQRFTSEMLNSEVQKNTPHMSVKEPVKFDTFDSAYSSRKAETSSVPYSQPIQKPVRQIESTIEKHDAVKAATFAMPFKTPSWVKPPEVTEDITDIEIEGVTLRRPSDFWRYENENISYSGSPRHSFSNSRSIIETTSADYGKPTPIQASSMAIIDSGVIETIKHSPRIVKRSQFTTAAVPYKPPNWVKISSSDDDDDDEVDGLPTEYPSWIPLSVNSNVEPSGTSFQATSATKPHLKRASSFQYEPTIERRHISTSYVVLSSPTSNKNSQQQINNVRGGQSSISHDYNIQSSMHSKKPTSSGKFVTAQESSKAVNNRVRNYNSSQLVRRSSSDSFTSLPRRSQASSMTVKSLVSKFSSNK